MKIRVCLVLLAVVCAVLLSGCQGSVAKTSQSPVVAKEDCTKPTPVQVDGSDVVDMEKPKVRTVRMRNPETGKIMTKQVPVTPAETSEKKFEIRWQENCSVQKAFEATGRVLYETLRLQKVFDKNRRGSFEPVSDYLSGILKARSTINIVFDVTVFLDSADSCVITIKASSETQPKDIIQKHCLFLRQQISEAIQQDPQDESVPYPKTMVFDHTVSQIYDAIHNWAKKAGFDFEGSNSYDQFYGQINFHTNSRIHFNFQTHLIAPNKTMLEIDIQYYEGKEEFKMILKSLMDGLESMKEDKPVADEATGT